MAPLLLLARHAAVGPEAAGRYLGRTDLPLGPAADAQIRDLAARLAPFRPARCLASPLRRAADTAARLAPPLGLTVETDRDLREIDFGRWDGRTFDQIVASDPELVARWDAADPAFAFPEGEAMGTFLGRVARAAERLAALPEDRVLVVTHGGVVRGLLCRLLGLSIERYLAFRIDPASLAVVELAPVESRNADGTRGAGVLAALYNPPRPTEP
jgi:broad specificity phosphatase PhoE